MYVHAGMHKFVTNLRPKHLATFDYFLFQIEQETIALSRLGYVYDKVYKIRHKAQDYYHRSVQLALSMKPRNFDNHSRCRCDSGCTCVAPALCNVLSD